MISTMQSLGIDKLPREERLALVHAIWDSIAMETHPPLLSEAQGQELERRAAEDDSDPENVISWEQAKSQILNKFTR